MTKNIVKASKTSVWNPIFPEIEKKSLEAVEAPNKDLLNEQFKPKEILPENIYESKLIQSNVSTSGDYIFSKQIQNAANPDESERNKSNCQNNSEIVNHIADYVPSQRVEWKRYKQYTKKDVMAAIEEVKKGKLKH